MTDRHEIVQTNIERQTDKQIEKHKHRRRKWRVELKLHITAKWVSCPAELMVYTKLERKGKIPHFTTC